MTTAYITVDDADTYFSERLNTSAWDISTTTDKGIALKDATKRIDRLNFIGEKNESDQERQFPRYDDTTIPYDIQYATAELAMVLLDDIDPNMEIELLGMKSQGLASARSTYDRSFVPEHLQAGIPSSEAWAYLKPYLVDPQSIEVNRAT